MRCVLDVPKTFVSALAAVALLAGALALAAPKASADLSQCPGNAVCVWGQANYQGNFSWWPASSTGCHNHAGIPNVRSAWNRTGYNVRFGGAGTLPSGTAVANINVTGDICWP